MPDIQLNAQSITTGSTSGTTAPASGTIETWTVAALGSGVSALLPGQTYALVDANSGATANQKSEIIRVTACTGPGATSITVIRGADNTTPYAHATATVFKVVAVSSFFNSGVELAYAEVAGASISTAISGSLVYSQVVGAGIVVPPSAAPVWIEYEGSLAVTTTTGAGVTYLVLAETTSGSMAVIDSLPREFVGTNSGTYSKFLGAVAGSKRIGPTLDYRLFGLYGVQIPDTGSPTTQILNSVANPTSIVAYTR